MNVGFAMLVHDAFDRAAQVASYWAERGCPVVIHVDKRVDENRLNAFQKRLNHHQNVLFCQRFSCEWGTWSLVEASKAAAKMLLARFPAVNHVFLTSGSCLPLRPVDELSAFLAQHSDVDFIESVTVDDVPWIQGGLDIERFTLRFPVGWKKRRFLFDSLVRLQRTFGLKRKIPAGLEPHLGSQWWCLTRRTLTDILHSTRAAELQRYFKTVWIPDESYFQTVVRLHARKIESRSLTLTKFDFQGKPHVFYDDHRELLRQSDCFVARKVWSGAESLYQTFLSDDEMRKNQSPPAPNRVDRVFSLAVQRRTRGRPGLVSPGRFPDSRYLSERTAARYLVFCGLGEVFQDFPDWFNRTTGLTTHGHLFAPNTVDFAQGANISAGALSDAAALRDHHPKSFLRNLIWNTRGERQAFLFGAEDQQEISQFLCEDPNARITLVTGGWALRLFHKQPDPSLARARAAELQKAEACFTSRLRDASSRARVRVLSLAELLENPMEVLQLVVEQAGVTPLAPVAEVPKMTNIDGFDDFLQGLKNLGMNPYLVGDFHSAFETGSTGATGHRPYLVQ